MNRVRNTLAGFRTDFAVVAISSIYFRTCWASCAVARNTGIVLANIAELAVAYIAASVFTFTAGWVAVLVEVAMHSRAARAYWNTDTTGCICRVADFAFFAVLITKARWARLTCTKVVALVACSESKFTSIVCGTFTSGRRKLTSLASWAF